MLQTTLQKFIRSLRKGLAAGFTAGMIIVFLILIGIPIRIPAVALFLFLLVIAIFGLRLARQLEARGLGAILKNALAMGILAALIVAAPVSLVNRWLANRTDVKQYFDAVTADTITVLSGVPAAQLGPNPPIDPLTGTYPEGAVLRTNPMRLTFDRDSALHLQLGLTGEAWINANIRIGGFYGFALLLIAIGVASAALTWAAERAEVGRYRRAAVQRLSGNPITHGVLLLLPLIFFALLWLTERQGGRAAIINLGSGHQQLQLLMGFLIVLFGLVAVRSAQPTVWRLNYPARLALVLGVLGLMMVLALARVVYSKSYFIAPPSEPKGSETLCVLAILIVGGLLAVQNVLALRRPDRLEAQFASTVALGSLLLMPLYFDQYQNDVMTLVGINILLGLGLNIVVGYAGLLDLGYVAFFALGAYTYGFLSSTQMNFDENNQATGLKYAGNTEAVIRVGAWVVTAAIVSTLVIALGLALWRRAQAARARAADSERTLIHLPQPPTAGITLLLTVVAIAVSAIVAMLLDGSGLYHDLFHTTSPFLVGLLAGVIVAALSGILLGIPVLRLRGDYLAIVTLGFGEIIRLMFNNLRNITGGAQGVIQIPRPLPEGAEGSVVNYLAIVYLVFLGAGLVAFFSTRLKQSRIGRAWSAMRSDEDIAQSMGVNLVQTKLTAFAIGAAFAGIGGVLFAARQRNIFPGDFTLDVSISVLSLVIIGGMGSIPGVIMGAIVLIGIPEVLRELSTYRILAFGALLVVMVIIRPKGLLPAPMPQLQERARTLIYKVHDPEESQP